MNQSTIVEWYNSLDSDDLDDVKLDFAIAVERALERTGKKRVDLAKELHVSSARVTKVLSGESNLTMELMHKIAVALDHKINIQLSPASANSRWSHVLTSQNAWPNSRVTVSNPGQLLLNPLELKLAA